MLITNKYQTQLTEDLIKELPKSVYAELVEIFDGIIFLQRMAAPDRRKVTEMPKDEEGKVIVDFENPHILEDMDYFRQAAIHFQEHGKYTNLYPNPHPRSEYTKFWREEARRCRDGLVREKDGEWIPGYFYFYLNYSRIEKVVTKEGSKRAERVFEFPNPYDGDYFFFHYLERARNEGKHTATLKKRGSGFSFKGGSKLARNFILGESSVSKIHVNSFAIADEKEYLTKDGVLNKFINIADFCAKHTPFPGVRELKNSMNDMHWQMGYQDAESGIEEGTKNQVIGVTLKNDPEKARGKRGALIEWEEAGKFGHFLKAWGVARPSVEEDGFAFGLMNAYGTGGTEGADFFGLQEIFYNPEGYNIFSIANVFDKGDLASTVCSFFFGTYLNAKGYYDEDGNSDVVGAIIRQLLERDKIRKNSSDPNTIVQYIAENPITPQEAIMRREGSIFPVSDIKDYLSDIIPRFEKFISPHWVGRLSLDGEGKVTWKLDDSNQPIRDFPLRDNTNKTGCLEIFEMPYKDSTGRVPSGLYIAGIDPIDDDTSGTNSLYSIFIMNTLTDRIVAEYTGRTFDARDCYELTRRALMFYNAQALYENDKKGLYAYFRNKNCLYLLADTPEIIRDMEIGTISRVGNKSKGVNSSKKVNAWGRALQAQWMMQDAYVDNAEEQEGPAPLNLHRIRSVGYLKEALSWNPDGNFDRVSSMGMLMILRADRERATVYIDETETGLESDDFWDRSYGTKKSFYMKK
jgi:hypothetical protein